MERAAHLLGNEYVTIGMSCNTKKTVCMVFQPTRRDRIIAFPLLKIGENDIQYVSEFRYLGNVINNRLTDDDNKNKKQNKNKNKTKQKQKIIIIEFL